jgi:hypothetical protein
MSKTQRVRIATLRFFLYDNMQNQSKSKGILLAPFLRSRTGSCHLRSTR